MGSGQEPFPFLGGRKPASLPSPEPAEPVSGNVIVPAIAESAGKNPDCPDQSPPAAQGGEDREHGVGTELERVLLLEHDGRERPGRHRGREAGSGGVALERREADPVPAIAPDDEIHQSVAEVAFAVEIEDHDGNIAAPRTGSSKGRGSGNSLARGSAPRPSDAFGTTRPIRPGDVVEVELEGAGVLRNRVRAS